MKNNTSITPNSMLDYVDRQSFEKNGFLITTMHLPVMVPGFSMNILGTKILTVNSVLPRAERSAVVRQLIQEAQHA